MKIFCSLLLVGLFVYREGESHKCDYLAVNLAITQEEADQKHQDYRTGEDLNNQYITVEKYLNIINGTRHICRTSGMDNGADFPICTTTTHGSGCGPIVFDNKVLKIPGPNPKTNNYKDVPLENNVIFQSNVYSLHLKTGLPYAVAKRIKLVDRDDLIFQADKFFGFKLNESKTGVEKIDENDEIYKKLLTEIGQEFATARIGDGFGTSITCDEKVGWGFYKTEIIDKQLEGKVALPLDQALLDLDTNHREQNPRDNPFDIDKVKPVSTVFPEVYLKMFRDEIEKIDFLKDVP